MIIQSLVRENRNHKRPAHGDQSQGCKSKTLPMNTAAGNIENEAKSER